MTIEVYVNSLEETRFVGRYYALWATTVLDKYTLSTTRAFLL
jgi:hypothetical protein